MFGRRFVTLIYTPHLKKISVYINLKYHTVAMSASGMLMQGSILPVTIPPRAHPRGFAIFFLLGGLFPTPGHAERDNSPPPRHLIDQN